MANELKELVVKGLISNYRNTSNYLVVSYQGIKALEFDQLRKDLRKKKICMEIVKNSLAVIAFKELGITGLVSMLIGPSAIVTGGDDPVVMAKETLEWSKKIPFLRLRGGFVDGTTVSVNDINDLAKLPAMPVLRTQIITGINAPIVGVASAFNAVLRSLATVFQAVKDKKEKSGV
ncbi:MAG: 50S ribosomal protein L10 [Candidatus Brocadia sp. AMX2]|uniref:Large ribosomal subunit protein uL10 n=1 Tax=Candidatus Brocadia sinica JPN1 TaxID=1197129 RepID=A0ABQ0JY39_9BACT|nr:MULTISPECIES: 50S ribosomal protein L10 [Brocadia]MBC6934011.1 50S ribosomal protein L10 [Candidatus Brocadia sp.]MBL1167569.1 50S ribosomal protein L10 [Candidatus Brocadia sp. AMX1]MCK6467563.1 50S ribosomal protein L10 [Candidatus Brocadia sinica]NOG40540.1 50S ribosomal protein L10 [Planctomycetota bacterium]KAA0241504.1 MAG: 50S ribosomal protein L10 [Candidatus Brocadia sp. AMX2]